MIIAPTLADAKDALSIDDDDDQDDRLNKVLAAATALANNQAPGAPQDVGREAILLAVGWLFEQPMAVETSYAAIWQRCGAKGLLSPWTIRRAGAIKAD